MKIEEIEAEFISGDSQRIDMMARKILSGSNLSHKFINDLSLHAERFDELLRQTNPSNRRHLLPARILGRLLTEVKNGNCTCSIVRKDFYNPPTRLMGLLEIIETEGNPAEYSLWTLSKCLSCGQMYESKEIESGHGSQVLWSERSS